MFQVFVRSLLSGVALALMLTVALLTTSLYSLFAVGGLGVRETKQISEARGMEIALALSQMASERFDEEMGVKLSSVMDKIVTISKQRSRDFTVDEIFMLRSDGSVMAANEIARVARDAETRYTDARYEGALSLPQRNPLSIKAIEERSTAAAPLYESLGASNPGLREWMEASFPGEVTTRYHIAVAIYPVDTEIAEGSLHMFVTVESVNEFVMALGEYSLNTLILAFSFVFLVTFAMILLLMLAFAGLRRKGAPGATGGRSGAPFTDEDPVELSLEDEEVVLDDYDRRDYDRYPDAVASPELNTGAREPYLPEDAAYARGNPDLDRDFRERIEPRGAEIPLPEDMTGPSAARSFAHDDDDEYPRSEPRRMQERERAEREGHRMREEHPRREALYYDEAPRRSRFEDAEPYYDDDYAPRPRRRPRVMDAIPLENMSTRRRYRSEYER